MYLLLMLLIIAIIGIAWSIVFYNKIFNVASKIIHKIRLFVWYNKNFVDISFLISYAIIQLIFILQISKPNADVDLLVTLFVLALLTILGIERIFLKSRFDSLSELSNSIMQDYNILKEKYHATLGREKQLINFMKIWRK